MALNLDEFPSLRRPSGKPTILQLIPATEYPYDSAVALALCQTDQGRMVLGVDAAGRLFILGSEVPQ